MTKCPTFIQHLSPHSGLRLYVYMYIMFSRFYQARDIKISGRNNLSECPHKYLMCSISSCEASSVCVRLCVCADCNYLAAAKTPIEEEREGE